MNVNKIHYALLLCFFIFIISRKPVSAGGAIFTNEYSQIAPAESSGVILFDGKREILFDSITFTLNPLTEGNFGWIIAVPSKPEVEQIKDETFVKFEKLTQKAVEKENWWQKLIFFDIEEEKFVPHELFTRPIDIWQYDIIEPDGQVEKLDKVVRSYGYFIPKAGRVMLRDYEKRNWYFIVAHVNAVHIQLKSNEAFSVSGAHTLPLKISFDTDKPIYPLKLAQIEPDYDSVAVSVTHVEGLTSEEYAGEKSEQIDEILAAPSPNKFPHLPLSYSEMKTELYVLADTRVTAHGFTTIYSNTIYDSDVKLTDLNGSNYFGLPKPKMILTRLIQYNPLISVEDVELEKTSTNRKVNAYSSMFLQYLKVSLVFVTLIIICRIICKKRNSNKLSNKE